MDTLTVLVAEEDGPSRERLIQLLEQEPDIDVVAACADGQETMELIQTCAPQLVLLNVELDTLGGFAIIERLSGDALPAFLVVADTAQYALQAFDARAVDYVLKPLDEERLRRALGRARTHIQHQKLIAHSQQLLTLLHNTQLHPGPSPEKPEVTKPERQAERLVLKTGSRFLLVDMDEIDWVEADDVYVRLHTGNKSQLMRARLKNLERQLDAKRFVRIHRSTIVNLSRVREVTPHPNGGAVVSLRNGKKLKMSRSYLDRMTTLLAV